MSLRKNQQAALALRHVLSVGEGETDAQKLKKLRDEYQSLWLSFPLLVMKNGLLQTLSFYEYKHGDKTHGSLFFSHFCEAVELSEEGWTTLATENLEEYLVHNERAIEIATWYKHFTKSQYEELKDAASNEE
jgi:CRISPR type III-B/RAMP module-associated protein Cmr5